MAKKPAASNLAGQRSQKPKPATAAQKKLMRLKEGYPLSTGQTPKKPPATSSGTTIGTYAAKAIMKRASDKEQAGKKKPKKKGGK